MNLETFFEKTGFSLDISNGPRLAAAVRGEMERGLTGKKSSLKMLPAFVGLSDPELERDIIIIDAGGSNLRVGTMRFTRDMKPLIRGLVKTAMPGTARYVDAGRFYADIAAQCRRIKSVSRSIGFCFSYPARITPQCDAQVLLAPKELKAGIVGTMAGSSLLQKLSPKNPDHYCITVVNDTVAALLGGKAVSLHRNCSGWIGLVLGTGTNIAYVEKVENITKLSARDCAAFGRDAMVINTEMGALDIFPRTAIDIALDNTSNAPGVHKAEKMISGKYLGPIVLALLRQAAATGMLSPLFAQKVLSLEELDTTEVSHFLSAPSLVSGACTRALATKGKSRDQTFTRAVMERVVERSAFFVACELAAMLLKTGAGKRKSAPAGIMADGSTFYGLKGYQKRIERHLAAVLGKDKRAISFISAENPNLIGAGLAALVRD